MMIVVTLPWVQAPYPKRQLPTATQALLPDRYRNTTLRRTR